MKNSLLNRAIYQDEDGEHVLRWTVNSEVGWMKWAKKQVPARKAEWYLRGLRWRQLEDGQRRVLGAMAKRVFG